MSRGGVIAGAGKTEYRVGLCSSSFSFKVPVVVCIEVISQDSSLALITPYRALFLPLSEDLLPSYPPRSHCNRPLPCTRLSISLPNPIPRVFFPPSLSAPVVIEGQDHARQGRGHEVGDWMHPGIYCPMHRRPCGMCSRVRRLNCLKLTKLSYFKFTFI